MSIESPQFTDRGSEEQPREPRKLILGQLYKRPATWILGTLVVLVASTMAVAFANLILVSSASAPIEVTCAAGPLIDYGCGDAMSGAALTPSTKMYFSMFPFEIRSGGTIKVESILGWKQDGIQYDQLWLPLKRGTYYSLFGAVGQRDISETSGVLVRKNTVIRGGRFANFVVVASLMANHTFGQLGGITLNYWYKGAQYTENLAMGFSGCLAKLSHQECARGLRSLS